MYKKVRNWGTNQVERRYNEDNQHMPKRLYYACSYIFLQVFCRVCQKQKQLTRGTKKQLEVFFSIQHPSPSPLLQKTSFMQTALLANSGFHVKAIRHIRPLWTSTAKDESQTGTVPVWDCNGYRANRCDVWNYLQKAGVVTPVWQ